MDENAKLLNKNSIKQLDFQTAKRISSGQVITSMPVAVKELIENSLDARATCLSIRFVDYGKELIEVIDNGSGIDESGFEYLGKRNCTSKLQSFEDLDSVETFGFRGEALSSLCNIAKISIHTRHASKSIGTCLVFNTENEIADKKLMARDVGTTVSLSQLFFPLPVRRKELISNARRSFDKTLSLIYQYCVGIVGMKISCYHMPNSSGRYSLLFTSTGYSIQSNIIEIFNYKQFSHLMPFVCDKEIEDIDADFIDFEIKGFISKPDTGCGRSSADRQYFYLNDRPCDLSSLNKCINQIYRVYNRNQYPFILLKIVLDEKLIDRNLTPDKRKILLADNHSLFKIVRHSVEKMFIRESTSVESMSQMSVSSLLKRPPSDDMSTGEIEVKIFKRCSSPCDSLFNEDFGDKLSETGKINVIKESDHSLKDGHSFKDNQSDIDIFSGVNKTDRRTSCQNKDRIKVEKPSSVLNSVHPFFASLSKPIEVNSDKKQSLTDGLSFGQFPDISSKSNKICSDTENKQLQKDELTTNITEVCESPNQNLIPLVESDDIQKGYAEESDVDLDTIIANRQRTIIDWSADQICNSYKELVTKQGQSVDCDFNINFKAKITPEDNDIALKELKHTLTKQCFNKMKVIGQFNLGFIIAKLGKNLFIIDQHAIDERYNFERFLKDPDLNYQNLVCPLNLRLNALNELIVIDHLSTFSKLGFVIVYNPEAAVGQRILLSKIPIGKEWIGGRSDIEEIIAAIRDSPTGKILEDQSFILSGLKREIAYRACRSSVMIGESLTLSQMDKILSRICDLRDPWHCAHNRPTIRHLICLEQFTDFN